MQSFTEEELVVKYALDFNPLSAMKYVSQIEAKVRFRMPGTLIAPDSSSAQNTAMTRIRLHIHYNLLLECISVNISKDFHVV